MKHACPVCGRELLHTCFHDGEDVQAVDMTEGRWTEIRRHALDDEIEEAEQAAESLPHLRAERAALG